jgi:simple sugar transport system permease protein
VGVNIVDNKFSLKGILKQNAVVFLFLALTVAGIMLSELSFPHIMTELVTRIGRNTFLVLSLIIPIIAGVGLNFGIVVGAMAGQIGLILITYFGYDGIGGLLIATLVATLLAIFFGYLTALLYNKTKGQEMIAGLIVGFFANGIYQFIFLFIIGAVIPVSHAIVKPDGIGLRNTIAMGSKYGEGIKYTIDNIAKINLWQFIILLGIFLILHTIITQYFAKKKAGQAVDKKTITVRSILGALVIIVPIMVLCFGSFELAVINVPLVSLALIAALCLFNVLIMKTKLGQNFRAIGRSQHIASVAGINVDKTRMIAIILSTVFASWGQIIFLQNIGTMNTYGSHMQVGMFAIASILIGGATVSSANIWHAIIGVILFQSVFIVSPTAGKALFGDAQIGEFFRAFVVYGVIGVSLCLHSWKKVKKNILKKKEES